MIEFVFNRKNAVTADIKAVQSGNTHVVRKSLARSNRPGTPEEWRLSTDPDHWNFWEREALVYRSGLSDLLVGSGVRLPALNGSADTPVGIDLDLELIEGRGGSDLTLADYQQICRAWGHAQGILANSETTGWTWLSDRFIRNYSASKPVDYTLIDDPAAWQRPLIADNWDPALAEGLGYLYAHREDLFDILERASQIPSHLDFWPNNAFVDDNNSVVLIDWGFFGSGAPGEDVGNFLPDAVFDEFVTPALLPEMERILIPAYREGLKEGGFETDEAELLRNIHASAVKYVWLGPLLLKRAGQSEQVSYGGDTVDDANRQYRARGECLAYLCRWAEQALR